MKRTIHDGSVSYSVTVPDPLPGSGRSAKTADEKRRRHMMNMFARFQRAKLRIDRANGFLKGVK